MNVGIDAMGGDFAPKECINAVVKEANSENCDSHFFVFGEPEALKEYAEDLNHPNITVVPSGESISMGEHAIKAVSTKKRL